MASQSFNLQASGSNSSVHANQSGSQVDLTLRLGLSEESDKNLPHFGPIKLPHAHLNFTAPYTTQAINHIDMVCGRGNTAHNPWSPERRSHYMNSNGLELHSGASMGGGPLHTNSYNYNNIHSMPQMNEYTLLNPSSRRGDHRGNGGSSSSRRTSRRLREANYNDPSKRCTNYNCGTNNTPMWRKGPLGPKSLCNACGIKYRKEEEKRKARGAAEHSGTSNQGKG
ncbi:GATA transcription factor 29 isoform X2 [Corylus avellana]|nr:GATA transcription factor 29 isoform X2 [Corylus avellana]